MLNICFIEWERKAEWDDDDGEMKEFAIREERHYTHTKISFFLLLYSMVLSNSHKKGTSKSYQVHSELHSRRKSPALSFKFDLQLFTASARIFYRFRRCHRHFEYSLKVFPLTFAFSVITFWTTFVLKRIAWDSLSLRMIMLCVDVVRGSNHGMRVLSEKHFKTSRHLLCNFFTSSTLLFCFYSPISALKVYLKME